MNPDAIYMPARPRGGRAGPARGLTAMRRRSFAWLAPLAALLAAMPLPASAQTRAELLYELHCVACHTAQVHWRDRRIARNLDELQEQVRNWQAAGNLNWSEEDIVAVARFLDDRYYRFTLRPSLPPQVGAARGDGR